MIRQTTLKAFRRLGAEDQLRAVQRAVEGPTARRNRRDDEHLRVVMAAVLRSESSCIDVGANDGAFVEEFRRLAPDGQHLAIEPIPALAESLRDRFPDIEVHQCALSDRKGTREFFVEQSAPTRSGFVRQQGAGEARSIAVEVKRIDDIVPREREIALIKIDVEGAEEEVLRGAAETLSRCRPLVALEHGASAVRNYGTSHGTIHRLLAGYGLALFDMDGNGPLSAGEFDRLADPPGKRWNFLARAV